MTTPSPIILIHGAWSDARSWDAVVPLLQAAGHSVTAIDLPGHGGDAMPPEDVGLADYARRIADVLSDQPPALLVGHSMGGMAISAAAELTPSKVRKLVYVAAFLPQDGQSLLDLIKQQDAPGIRDAMRPAKTPGATVLDASLVADILFQDADPELRARALATLGPQPNRAQTDPAKLSAARFGCIPRAYVTCEKDRTVTPALQRKMLADSPCGEVFSINSGHVPQLTRPAELAAILSRL